MRLDVRLPKFRVLLRREIEKLKMIRVRRDLDENWNAPSATGPRTEAFGHPGRLLRFHAPTKIDQFAQRDVVTIADSIVELHSKKTITQNCKSVAWTGCKQTDS